jgi:DNA recombination protein RmuC
VIIRLWLTQIEQKTNPSDELVAWLKDLGSRVESSTNMFNSRLDKAAYVIADVQKSIGEFSEIGRSMKDIQQILQSPKLRGNIGEQVLKELLSQYFPKSSFMLQYQFKNGEKVDVIIKTSQGIIPIDSKFPMENFRKLIASEKDEDKNKAKKEFEKDVKKHILDISRKYILPDEGTIDYALMYIPSETVYYEIVNNNELFDFAGNKKVLPVSPMSFYAYIKAILMSFEGLQIQSKAKEILILLQAIKKDYQKSDESFSILSRHIGNAYNQLNQVGKNFSSLGQKINSSHLIADKETSKKILE